MYRSRVERATKALKNGEMIIIMDDEDRENEADLVMAGMFSTPEKINFLAKEARGLICVSITKELSLKLDLPYMVDVNNSNHETAFTISIDARKAKTGISAFERDMTIKLMCDEGSTKDDFVRPGHIFPLITKGGGVLERTGHTEASIDLCKIAGLKPIAVICEMMKDDGSMPGNGDKFISDFARRHGMQVVFVSDLVQYRLLNENLVSLYERSECTFLKSKCEKYVFKDYMGVCHTAFKMGESEAPLIKFNKTRTDMDLMQNPREFSELISAMRLIAREGGVVIYMGNNSYRGDATTHKEFGIGAQILSSLSVKSFRLLTNNEYEFVALKGFNLDLVEKIRVDAEFSI